MAARHTVWLDLMFEEADSDLEDTVSEQKDSLEESSDYSPSDDDSDGQEQAARETRMSK